MLLLITPPVLGHAPRFVHIKYQDHEQHHCAANGVDECISHLPPSGRLQVARDNCLTGVDEQASATSYLIGVFLMWTCTFPNMLYAWGEEGAVTL
jgi:hypothetical protein